MWDMGPSPSSLGGSGGRLGSMLIDVWLILGSMLYDQGCRVAGYRSHRIFHFGIDFGSFFLILPAVANISGLLLL